MPVLLALLLGFQQYVNVFENILFFSRDTYYVVSSALLLILYHSALAMLAGVVSPSIIIAGAGGANLGSETTRYLVSTSLIVCGILSLIQITRFHIRGTSYVF